jgi:hypothetical protein
MTNKLKESIIIILLINILLEVSGNGLFDTIKCSDNYNYKRCLKIGNDDPQIMMDDFYQSLKVLKSEPDEINTAWNMLSQDIQDDYKNMQLGIKGKDYFYNFWGDEADKFTILSKSIYYKNKFISNMTFNLCYLRDAQYAKENNQMPRFCSKDTYRLIRKKENPDSPYLWSMDTYHGKSCDPAEEKLCHDYEFK